MCVPVKILAVSLLWNLRLRKWFSHWWCIMRNVSYDVLVGLELANSFPLCVGAKVKLGDKHSASSLPRIMLLLHEYLDVIFPWKNCGLIHISTLVLVSASTFLLFLNIQGQLILLPPHTQWSFCLSQNYLLQGGFRAWWLSILVHIRYRVTAWIIKIHIRSERSLIIVLLIWVVATVLKSSR